MVKLASNNEERKSTRATLLLRLAKQHEETAQTYRELASLDEVAPEDCSTIKLPPDATADSFNRYCREGLVDGAQKRGRVWTCSREAWAARKRRVPTIAKTRSAKPVEREYDADLLAELGARRSA